jgi:hypothetical protein
MHAAAGAEGRATTAPKYPHPFFDQGQAYLPTSYKNMFHWCRYYFLTNPAVNSSVSKMAEYPITPIVFKTENQALRTKYEEITKILNLKSFRIEVGLDYYTYGNCYVSIIFPFRKFLICRNCKHHHDIKDVKTTKYRWVSMQYQLECAKCGHHGFCDVKDQSIKSLKGIRLVRWDPERVDVKYDDFTGISEYFYDIPQETSNEIRMGKRRYLEDMPDVFVKSVQRARRLVLSQDNLYHFRRPTLAQKSMGYGTPLVLPVLKDLHYLGILRRSQESIAQEHIVPMRIIFPSSNSPNADPYSMLNLMEWKNEVEKQISQWKIDPNRIPIMPLPLGVQQIGGEGRALILHQEYRVWMEHIIAGMGVPPEFVFGGVQYSGTNLTMFQLHNKFLSYIDDQRELVFDFILNRVASYMNYPTIDGDFRPFKMADDLQRTMLYFQLVQGQKLADRTLLEDLGFDPALERRKMDEERGEMLELQRRMQIQQAHIQGDVMAVNAKYQAESQRSQVQGQFEVQKLQAQLQEQMQQEQTAKEQAKQAPQITGSLASNGALPDGAMTGDQVAPGFPQGATAYSRNGSSTPQTGIPPWFGVERTGANKNGAQMDISYVAKRAAAYIRGLPSDRQNEVLNTMSVSNPQLHQMVLNMLDSRSGAQTNPVNPAQMPMPQMRPPRRDARLISQ